MSSIRTPLTVSPHEYFGDITGRPLDYGTIYFGEPDKDPEFYPIDVYSDEALTQPIPQPIRTKGGFINVNGDIIDIFGRPAIYSVKVLDQYGRKIFYKGKAMRNNVNDDIIAEIGAAIQQSKDDGVEYAKKAVREAIDNTVTDGSPIADTMIAVDGSLSQRTINKGLESIADLSTIKNPKDGLRIYVKSYHARLGIGGGYFVYDSTKANVNDSGLVINGWVRQLDAAYVIPEHFGAKSNVDFDNADALNKAFATGLDVYSTPEKTYTVKQRLKSKGQKTAGGFKILVNRDAGRGYTLNESVATNSTDNRDDSIKMLYVESAWDLAEFLIIKSLGFNIVHHYCGFANYAGDNAGTVQQMLDNAKTAGLKVSLGTEQHHEARDDLQGFIKRYDNHPVVWGYAVYDEPKYRGFSADEQDSRLSIMRQVTSKTLFAVDYETNPFKKHHSTNYDLFLVNNYAHRNATLESDLAIARRNFGLFKAQTKTKTIPCIGSFLFKGPDYSDDIARVVEFSKIFGQVGNGDYAAFVWDGMGDINITKGVREDIQLRDLVLHLNNQNQTRPLVTTPYLFGYAETQHDFGLNDLLKNLAVVDKFSNLEHTFNAYPLKVTKEVSSGETDRTTAMDVPEYSGLFFKGDYARFATTIGLDKYLTLHLEYAYPSVTGPSEMGSTIKFCASRDLLKVNVLKSQTMTSAYQIIMDSFATPVEFSNLVFEFRNPKTPNQYYRQVIRGAIIVTNW